MSRQLPAPSAVQVQSAQFANDYINHPDFRLVVAFSLGWVFLSSIRHIWFSAFVRELVWSCKAISYRLRGKADRSIAPTGPPLGKASETYPSSVRASELYRREQRDTLVLLMCMAFMLGSLSSFLSLLTFYPNGSSAASFVVAASTIAFYAARVFGFLALSLDLRHRMVKSWELCIFWSAVAVLTVLNGVVVGVGPGRLVTPFVQPSISLCFRKRFLPLSLVSSILSFTLELYIIIRVLSLVKPPRLKLSIVQDTRIMQAGSLLFLDLLVVVPNATMTSLIAEFIPLSIGALSVLAAFNSQSSSVPTQLDGPVLISRRPSHVVGDPEPPPHRSDVSDIIRDIEAFTPPLPSPRVARTPSTPPLNSLLGKTAPISPRQPVEISLQTTIVCDVSPPVAQLEPGDRPRQRKILSYSSPVWETFGTPQQSNINAPTRPRSQYKSPDLPLLHRMRARRSAPTQTLSPTSSIPSPSSRWAAHQSWGSRLSTYPPISEGNTLPGYLPLKESVQPSHLMSSRSLKTRQGSLRSSKSIQGSLRSSKSKQGSKSSRSSKSKKGSIRSMKEATTITTGGGYSGSTQARSSLVYARISRGFPAATRQGRLGLVRGPRPPPSASRTNREKL
ncbi:hypothetical protein B0F90DRAFT_1685855 [Multifurca ochricompacta]|uniref:Uncharacterized protein n=1 Tax=Multifurca ochricompacta TaxID=376703 RepID=A0AAD4QSL1_9AGAM|nr:hypothetical protein B0F90DRAFT_1685855 [Multifurca ochricompacta]